MKNLVPYRTLVIEGKTSAHLVHGPGSDGALMCLQLARKVLKNGNHVVWIGDLQPTLAVAMLGDLSEARLANLKVWNDYQQEILDFLPGPEGLLVFHSWCSRLGRASKDELSRVIAITESSACTVIATSLGNQNPASNEPSMTARSGEKLERAGLITWYLSREPNGANRSLQSGESRLLLQRTESGFTVL